MSMDNKKWYEHMIKVGEYSSEQLDKAIVYISGGSLALSIGFVEKIVKITNSTDTTILKLSWIMFISCLVVNLLSHFSSIIGANCVLNKNEGCGIFFNIISWILNSVSILLILTGLVLFLVFIGKEF